MDMALGLLCKDFRDLSPVWAPRLNSFGLLSTLEDVLAFRQLTDQRDPEDPFWVFGLWRLPID